MTAEQPVREMRMQAQGTELVLAVRPPLRQGESFDRPKHDVAATSIELIGDIEVHRFARNQFGWTDDGPDVGLNRRKLRITHFAKFAVKAARRFGPTYLDHKVYALEDGTVEELFSADSDQITLETPKTKEQEANLKKSGKKKAPRLYE